MCVFHYFGVWTFDETRNNIYPSASQFVSIVVAVGVDNNVRLGRVGNLRRFLTKKYHGYRNSDPVFLIPKPVCSEILWKSLMHGARSSSHLFCSLVSRWPTKVVCITVLTGNRLGGTVRCGRPPLLLPSCRKLEFRLSALMDSDLAWVNGKSGRQSWRYADAFQHSIMSEAIYHLPFFSCYLFLP